MSTCNLHAPNTLLPFAQSLRQSTNVDRVSTDDGIDTSQSSTSTILSRRSSRPGYTISRDQEGGECEGIVQATRTLPDGLALAGALKGQT